VSPKKNKAKAVALQDKHKQHRTIVLNISEADYSAFMNDPQVAHRMIQRAFKEHPELFPCDMSVGYKLNGKTRVSKKLGLQMRKIKVSGISYRIRPSYILSYMRGKTEEVAKGLFLLRFGVPFWALAYIFDRNSMYWYRAFLSFSDYSLVGTTIRNDTSLPEDILADEHHIRIRGEKAYIATTIANECILGVEAAESASEEALTQAYGIFKEEAQDVNPKYAPKTANTDGWWATQNAWRNLFSTIFIIECFLHAYLKVKDRATAKLSKLFEVAADKIWSCYRATSKPQLSQRLRRLSEWATHQLQECPMKENLMKLCNKTKCWLAHLDFPNAYRTSNQLDRVMKFMDRHAFNSQMFHSTISGTTKNFRAFALLYNFSPSCPAVTKKNPQLISPAARLNGFAYHQNWLQNLLIAASLGGYRQHRNPL